ncbi:hypothetical protein EON68_00010 [archaeon]|nr:MAG: hypothetical protein EON68_00010 [archaeon]
MADGDGSAGGGGSALGLMKGVMLCNRPASWTPAASTSAASAKRFQSGVKHESVHPTGQNVALHELPVRFCLLCMRLRTRAARARALPVVRLQAVPPPPPSHAGPTEKIKAWLAELAETRARRAMEAAAAEESEAARRDRIAAQQQAFRDAVRGQPNAGTASFDSLSSPGAGTSASMRESKMEEGEERSTTQRAVAAANVATDAPGAQSRARGASVGAAERKKAAVNARAKPAWARTEGAQDAVDAAELDELVDFVEQLNFDQYVARARAHYTALHPRPRTDSACGHTVGFSAVRCNAHVGSCARCPLIVCRPAGSCTVWRRRRSRAASRRAAVRRNAVQQEQGPPKHPVHMRASMRVTRACRSLRVA